MTDTTFTRRSFVAASAASGLAGLAPFAPALAATGDDWGETFADALKRNPMLIGWKTPPDRLDAKALTVTGTWPAGLKGRFFRNGPSIHDRFGRRYRHWFDGDGMIQEFAIADGRIAHRGRTIRTPKLDREDRAGKRLYSGYGTHSPTAAPLRGPDSMNAANISVLHHGGELMALWEGGSATQLDEATLAAQGFKSWEPALKGVAFSAHPKVDPDGTLWNIGCNLLPRPALVLYHIDRAGKLVKAALVDAGPIGLVHDFVVTRKSLVLPDPALPVRSGAGGTGQRPRRPCLEPAGGNPRARGRQGRFQTNAVGTPCRPVSVSTTVTAGKRPTAPSGWTTASPPIPASSPRHCAM